MSDEQPSPPLLKWQPLIDKAKIRLAPNGKAVSVIVDIKENCKTEPANAFMTALNKAVTHQLNFSGSGEANPKIKNIKFALVNPKVARQRHAAMTLATFSQAERVLHLVEKAGIEAYEISKELRAYGKKALDPWYHSHNALTRLFTRPKDPKNPPLSTSRMDLRGDDEDRGPAPDESLEARIARRKAQGAAYPDAERRDSDSRKNVKREEEGGGRRRGGSEDRKESARKRRPPKEDE
ncbi:MAG TPA: hypothetical protein VMG10_07420 [Gemmataceae bacterium]|nr:hypothetical protein [Gemmataceae bacterium]